MAPQIVVWGLVFTLGAIAIIPIVYDARRETIDPFSPQVWFSIEIFTLFGLPTAVRLATNNFEFVGNDYGRVPKTTTMVVVLVAVISGAIAFYLGYRSPRGERLATHLPRFREGWSTRRALTIVAGLFIVGILSYLSLRTVMGSQTSPELAKGSSKVAFIGANLLRVGAIVLLATIVLRFKPSLERWLRSRQWSSANWRPSTRTIVELVGVVVFLAVVVALMYSLGLRSAAFGLVMVAIALVHYLFRRFSLAELALPFLFYLALPAWTLALVLSVASLDIGEFINTVLHPFFGRASPRPEFNNIVILFSGVPHQLGFQYGETFASAFFALGPIHPFDQMQEVYNPVFLQGGAGYGVPITLIGELYLNFWWFGIPIGMMIFGFVMRAYYEWLINLDSSIAAKVLFSGVGSMVLLSGNFSNALPNLGLIALPLFICVAIISGGFVGNPVARVLIRTIERMS